MRETILGWVFVGTWAILIAGTLFLIVLVAKPPTEQDKRRQAEELARTIKMCDELGLKAAPTLDGYQCAPKDSE